ncbi:P-loop containing nucleoside triphosphate hydrolase protein [Powellomyces hirtus]|nr:P-loop containing nucleoside triphosphate hydrolase protein [Powellomyces hirtus]
MADFDRKSNDMTTTRVLLDGISGSAKRGELIAIMGASGAGKTTLLQCLSGRLSTGRLTGSITLDNQPRAPKTWKRLMAFVEQDDHLHAHLTVRETLRYAARLRLPSSQYTRAEKEWKADEVLSRLRLDKAAETRIGDGLTRGVSGGERKRVCVAQQIVADPDVLFLDEATSGLDSTAALSVLANVKRDAEASGRIVVVTIHQPSVELLELFSSVVVLCAGKVAYFGPVDAATEHFRSLGYDCPPHKNPADFFLDVVTIASEGGKEEDARVRTLHEAYRSVERARDAGQTSAISTSNVASRTASVVEVKNPSIDRNSWMSEFLTLMNREWKNLSRHRPVIIADFVRTFVLIILIGFASFRLEADQRGLQNRIGVLFVWPTNQMFVVLMPILTVVPLEKIIMMRERAAGSYRMLAVLLPALFFSFVATIPLYWMIGLQADFTKFLIWIGVNALLTACGVALALAVSCAVPTVQLAQATGPLLVVVFMLYGGQIINVGTLGWYFRWLHYLSPISYAYRALAQTELAELTLSCLPNEACVTTGKAMLAVYDLDTISTGVCALVLAGLATAWFVVAYGLLRKTSKPKMVVL